MIATTRLRSRPSAVKTSTTIKSSNRLAWKVLAVLLTHSKSLTTQKPSPTCSRSMLRLRKLHQLELSPCRWTNTKGQQRSKPLRTRRRANLLKKAFQIFNKWSRISKPTSSTNRKLGEVSEARVQCWWSTQRKSMKKVIRGSRTISEEGRFDCSF